MASVGAYYYLEDVTVKANGKDFTVDAGPDKTINCNGTVTLKANPSLSLLKASCGSVLSELVRQAIMESIMEI